MAIMGGFATDLCVDVFATLGRNIWGPCIIPYLFSVIAGFSVVAGYSGCLAFTVIVQTVNV